MTAALVIGIDPGLSGVIAMFQPGTGELSIIDMPVF